MLLINCSALIELTIHLRSNQPAKRLCDSYVDYTQKTYLMTNELDYIQITFDRPW